MTRRHVPRVPPSGSPVVCEQLVELVTDYLEGALDPDLRRRVEEHLAGCEHCTAYVGQTRRLLELTREAPDRSPSEDTVSRLRAEFRRLRG